MLDTLALQRILMNGTVLSLVLGVIILGSLRYNARLWLQDYPKPIRDKVPPLSAVEKRERLVLGLMVMGVLFGGVFLTTLQLRTYPAGAVSFGTAYLHIFLIVAMFNLFDAVVLDLFVITLLKPRFVILPGAEGMEYLFHDYRKHLTDFLKGMAFCAIASLPFALISVL
jgi:hypothetical protein